MKDFYFRIKNFSKVLNTCSELNKVLQDYNLILNSKIRTSEQTLDDIGLEYVVKTEAENKINGLTEYVKLLIIRDSVKGDNKYYANLRVKNVLPELEKNLEEGVKNNPSFDTDNVPFFYKNVLKSIQV